MIAALERGEIQTLLIAKSFSAPGAECPNCGHMDTNGSATCSACGRETRQMDDIADRLLATALKGNIEVIHMNDEPGFENTGGVAALLRFRADQNTAEKKAS